MPEVLEVEVEWTHLARNHDLWRASYCLYAYLHPEDHRILYLGKADYQTVRERLYGTHKDKVFDCILQRFGVESERVEVIQGEVFLDEGLRRSSALVADLESLLIKRLQPPCNRMSKRSRISRPGLTVDCSGDWPYTRTRFQDRG